MCSLTHKVGPGLFKHHYILTMLRVADVSPASCRSRPQCVVCSHHAQRGPHSLRLPRQDHQDVGGGHWVSEVDLLWQQSRNDPDLVISAPGKSLVELGIVYGQDLDKTSTLWCVWSHPCSTLVLQVLREDVYGPQRVGAHGSAQPGRFSDRQLLQRPDGARVGDGLQGVQGGAAGARACGRVHRLGPRQRPPHHLGGHWLRGTPRGRRR